MNYTNSYTINGSLFQEFLVLLGRMTQDQLIRQIEFMKVENEILRSKLPRRITTTPAEKRRLIKYGLPLGGQIKQVISIVGYSTFRRWVAEDVTNKKPPKRGRPQKTTEHYNTKRPHSGMANEPLEYKPDKDIGKLKCESRLGGMIKQALSQNEWVSCSPPLVGLSCPIFFTGGKEWIHQCNREIVVKLNYLGYLPSLDGRGLRGG